jgi:hypothetical protein
LWIQEVKKVVKEDKVKGFVNTYQMRTTKARVGETIVDFSTSTIAEELKLPSTGLTLVTLPDLTSSEAEEIFECSANWVLDNKWNLAGARHHWRSWFDFINAYLLFRPDEYRMEQKTIVAAIRTWKGYRVNWALIVQQKMHRKIQTRQTHNPAILPLYSAFFISCLCQNATPPAVRVRATSSTSRPQTPLATSSSLVMEFAGPSTRLKLEELEKQLAERRTKLEQVQEQNAEYLR